MEHKPTVIYIIADRRSGSTLLENILSKSDEIISVGELAMLKGHIFREGPGELWNWNCSCGKPIMGCEFWSQVVVKNLDETFETKILWPYKSLTVPLFSSRITCKTLLKYIDTPKNIQTIETLKTLYETIKSISGKRFIVDSSKDPLQALAIHENRDIEAKFIWLIRDLRAVTFSKLKRWEVNKRSNKGPFETMLDSFSYNRLCGSVWRCIGQQGTLKLDYEAVAADPQETINSICTAFGLQRFSAPEFMELANDHTIAGTPGRFERKPIAADNSWKGFYKDKKILNALGKMFNSI